MTKKQEAPWVIFLDLLDISPIKSEKLSTSILLYDNPCTLQTKLLELTGSQRIRLGPYGQPDLEEGLFYPSLDKRGHTSLMQGRCFSSFEIFIFAGQGTVT